MRAQRELQGKLDDSAAALGGSLRWLDEDALDAAVRRGEEARQEKEERAAAMADPEAKCGICWKTPAELAEAAAGVAGAPQQQGGSGISRRLVPASTIWRCQCRGLLCRSPCASEVLDRGKPCCFCRQRQPETGTAGAAGTGRARDPMADQGYSPADGYYPYDVSPANRYSPSSPAYSPTPPGYSPW